VVIEFLYWDPSTDPRWCPDCDAWIAVYDQFLEKNATMNRIQGNYTSQVFVNWTEYNSPYSEALRNLYGINNRNSLVIKSSEGNITVIQTGFNETYIRELVDAYLAEPPPLNRGTLVCHAYNGSQEISANVTIAENSYANSTPFTDYFDVGVYTIGATWNGSTQTQNATITNGTTTTTIAFQFGTLPPPPPQVTLMGVVGLAFTFGFFETFSPCLLALLSFVLSYTVGKTTRFREGVLQVMAFGLGFVSAAMLLGLVFGLVFLSMSALSVALTLGVCVVAIFMGLDLIGLHVLSLMGIKFETKPLVKELTRKYALTYAGLLSLGFLFYFLDPCIAPIFIPMASLLVPEYFNLVLLIFSIGVIIPFVIIGILAGSISKLARSTYRHKSAIRAISGIILIAYSIYLIARIVF
jgi:cytochrome c biogenesis protein CcdA